MLDFIYFGMLSLLTLVGVGAYFWSSRRESVKTLPFMLTVSGMLVALFGVFWVAMFLATAGSGDDYLGVIQGLLFTFIGLLVAFVAIGLLWVTHSKAIVFLKGAAIAGTASVALYGVYWAGVVTAVTDRV